MAIEMIYFDLNMTNSTHFYDIIPVTSSATRMLYTIHDLIPYTWYGIKMRSLGEWNGMHILSNFSDTVTARTEEGGMCVRGRETKIEGGREGERERLREGGKERERGREGGREREKE